LESVSGKRNSTEIENVCVESFSENKQKLEGEVETGN